MTGESMVRQWGIRTGDSHSWGRSKPPQGYLESNHASELLVYCLRCYPTLPYTTCHAGAGSGVVLFAIAPDTRARFLTGVATAVPLCPSGRWSMAPWPVVTTGGATMAPAPVSTFRL